jgi:hypothetical protein
MRKEVRNFNCPETEYPCVDGRCTKERCCERERLHAAEKTEVAAKQQRITNAEVWETIAPLIKR